MLSTNVQSAGVGDTIITVVVVVVVVGVWILIQIGKHMGEPRPQIVCPHCHVQGKVTSRDTKKKRGISGGKATGAVLTGGMSVLLTGLSHKENMVELRCANCRMKWLV